MGKKVVILFLFLLGLGQLRAQQAFQFTQYLFDQLAYNPATAGNDAGLSASLIYRSQWNGISGRPQTGALNIHQPLEKTNAGIGLALVNDRIGNFSFTKIQPTFAYKYRFGLNVLSLGISPSLYVNSLNSNFKSISDKSLDPSIPDNNISAYSGDLNIGAQYKAGRYFAGFSVVNLIGTRINRINTRLSRSVFIHGGYQFQIAAITNIEWLAALNWRTDLQNSATSQYDLSLTAYIKDSFWLGANYRGNDSFSPIIGYQKYLPSGRLKIAYAYDYTTSGLAKFTSGSHEIVLNYLIIKEKSVEFEKYKNVRFL